MTKVHRRQDDADERMYMYEAEVTVSQLDRVSVEIKK